MAKIAIERKPKTLTKQEGAPPRPLATAIDESGTRIEHYLPKEHTNYGWGEIRVISSDVDCTKYPLKKNLERKDILNLNLSYRRAIELLEEEAKANELRLDKGFLPQSRGIRLYAYPITQKPLAEKVLEIIGGKEE